MEYKDIIGIIGVGMILFAFFLGTTGRLSTKSTAYFAMNALGAGLACYASLLIRYWPFVALEGVWTIVSLYGLVKRKQT